MDLRQFAYVVAVVDEGGFTAAADALGVAQPSLSQGVRALEAELGVELFHRTGRAVVLTAAGEALVEPARRALRDADVARSAVAEVAGLTAGRLDLVCLPTLAVDPVAGLVGRFRTAHPGVLVRLAEPEDPTELLERVRSGERELGITELGSPATGGPGADAGPGTAASPGRVATGLEVWPLAVQDFVAVLPPGTHLPGRGRVPLAAVARLPLITTPVGTSTRRQVDEAFAAAGLDPVVGVETDHREVMASLVLAGAGATFLPPALAEEAADRGAVIRAPNPPMRRRVGLVHRAGPLSPAARAFLGLAGVGPGGAPARPRPRRR